MRTQAFNWVDFDDLSALRYNFANVACVTRQSGRWMVEIHHWRGTMAYPVASRATGKRYLERWADKQSFFWAKPRRR